MRGRPFIRCAVRSVSAQGHFSQNRRKSAEKSADRHYIAPELTGNTKFGRKNLAKVLWKSCLNCVKIHIVFVVIVRGGALLHSGIPTAALLVGEGLCRAAGTFPLTILFSGISAPRPIPPSSAAPPDEPARILLRGRERKACNDPSQRMVTGMTGKYTREGR